ncbi:hypothetical protein [Edaphocola aurantiacus]|uniref:hypothetical protein n=1 Tax=Edaphocola aurantiacus TaxID=2601682 RepID=UPI001C97AC51|nr:hypothetical protein [Edaphocola aurantiacus]
MYFRRSLISTTIVMCTLISCSQAQDRKTIDQIFYEVSGPVKTMTERQDMTHMAAYSKDTSYSIYYFSPKGDLSKIEFYNSFHEDKPGVATIGNITYFKKQQGDKRFYTKIQADNKFATEFYTLQKVNATTLKYCLSAAMGKDTMTKVFTLNKHNRFTQSVSSGRVYRFAATKKLDYFYDEQGKPERIIVTDTETKQSVEATLKNVTYDQYGNMLQGTYTDPDNKTVYTINRSYTYYTAP